MFKPISVLLTDFYKQVHAEQYDSRITKLVSYYTPRMSRLKDIDFVPVIGLQAFIKEYLIDHFNENFFNRSLTEILEEYKTVIGQTMGGEINSDKIIRLHELGYLPLEIRALDEGTRCPIKCPMIEISNTDPEFAWCTNLIESLMSNELWYQGCTATSAILYRNIVDEYYNATSDNLHLKKFAISEFGMRGLPGLAASMKASMGFLTSFGKTATIPAIQYINYTYGDTLREIGGGMRSTEHSVMCSGISLIVKEIEEGWWKEEWQLFKDAYPNELIDIKLIAEYIFIKRLLTQIHPSGNFSCVCDSYDYWGVVTKVLPLLKEEILSRDGTFYVRGDSGDPCDIVTKTVVELWNIFQGTTNSKGYKVLDSHIRAIYGDSITPNRAKKIYEILKNLKFSAENVALGAGSFSMLCLEEEIEVCSPAGSEKPTFTTRLQPFTRDTFGVAIKTTYGEYISGQRIDHQGEYSEVNGLITYHEGFDIFKNPKTDSGFKKSQKGACVVIKNAFNQIIYVDEFDINQAHNYEGNLLKPVFKNGEFIKTTTFNEVRNRLWNNEF